MAKDNQEKDLQTRRGQKPQNFLQTILRLVKYMSKQKWALVGMVVFAILAALFAAVAPSILGQATTIIYDGVTEGMAMREAGQTVDVFPIDFTAIRNIVFILIALYLGEALTRYLQRYITAVVSQRTVYNLRKELKEKLATLPIEYFDTHSVGDVMSRAVNDIEQIANTLQRSVTQFISSVVTFASVLGVMLVVDVRMSLIVIVSVGLSAVFIAFIAPKSQKQFARQQEVVGELNDRVEEVYSGHTIVKTYTREEDEISRLTEHSDELYDTSWRAQFYSGIMMPAVNFARDLGIFAITLYGGFGVLQGTVSLGNVQAFIQYVNRFSQPVRQIAQLANSIQITVASVERVFETLDEEEMENLVSNVSEKTDTSHIVEFENVQFKYNDMDELLMTDFNLTVEQGEMIAIVGPTGAGKSTLINLLERFYDVSGGSIRYKGKDVRDINRQELRENYSMVLQDTWLFYGTIWENIAYGNEEATAEDIRRAAKAAYVDEFVRRLPKGYDTIINEEASNISQGQKQLITIARAFLADPEILILDEATSSVDTRTEALVQNAMENVLAGRTSFVVAHRLSTIQDADKIIVMNHGDVMETGTHDELLERDGFYAGIYNAQFEVPEDLSMA